MSLTITIDKLTRLYSGREVISNVNLTLTPGITCLMGHNGSGKSTLMRLISLIEPPSSGEIIYAEEGNKQPIDLTLRRRVTMVLPKGGLFNSTVCANAAYGLKLRGIRGRILKERTHEVLDKVGLLDKIKQSALTLSSGEAQRLALARAFAISPDALYLDEPTASVDEENTEIIESLILGLHADTAPLILVSTHDKEQAARLGGKIITLKKGMIE